MHYRLTSPLCFALLALTNAIACSSESTPREPAVAAAGQGTMSSAGQGGAGVLAAAGALNSGAGSSGNGGAAGSAAAGGGGLANDAGASNAGGAASSAGAAGSAGAGPLPTQPLCPGAPYAATPLASENPTAERICMGFANAEGPVWVESQAALFFSNFDKQDAANNHPGSIWKYTPGGSCEMHIADTGSNGLALSTSGQLLAVVHVTQTLTEFDVVTKLGNVVVPDYMGMPFSSPNDLVVHSNGSIYFTDPGYEIGSREEVLPRAVYRVDPEGVVSVVTSELERPNGIALSPDESALYVSQRYESRPGAPGDVLSFALDEDGVPAATPTTLIDEDSDGIAVDCAGNLYLTGKGVKVYSPSGERLGTIDVVAMPELAPQENTVSNVSFGGPEHKTLFISGNSQLSSIELAIPGYP